MVLENIVLIVDDEPLGRTALQSLLFKEGYRLEFAVDGPSALKAAAEFTPDLILLDVMMPGMDGYEVCRKLRDNPHLAEIPVLLVTALDDPQSRLSGIEAGADDFITKPYDRVELRARIRTILRLNRFRRLVGERQKYQILFENSPCGLLIVDGTGQVLESNSIAKKLLENLLDPNAHTQNLIRAINRQDETRIRGLFESAKTTPMVSSEFLTRGLKGGLVWIELTVSLCPPYGQDACQVAIRDRTSERTLEAELRQSQKLESIGHLAGGIAKEFQNLLATINDSAQMALAILPEGESVRNDIHKIHEAGEKAATLTRQLLVFSHKQSQAFTEVNLNQTLAETEQMLRPILGSGINLQIQPDPNLSKIRGDRIQIEQILVNLALNSRDALPNGGSLTMETMDYQEEAPVTPENPETRSQNWVRLIVSDNGTGMPPEVLAHLFEPFFTTKEAGKGSGLGLATVYGIVHQAGGRIQVQSEMGKGTRVIIDWPRLEEKPAGLKPKSGFYPPLGK